MQNLFYFLVIILLIISLISFYFLIKMKDRLKELSTKLNLLEDQQAKDKQIIIETLNRQYTDVMLYLKSTVPDGRERELGDSNYFDKAKEIVIKYAKASATLLQRKLHIGYAQSARLLDDLEKAGIVGPMEGVQAREILAQPETEEFLSDDDEMLPGAIEFISQLKTVSPTRIQRKLRIGYARSARLLDILEEKGLVGPANGSEPRQVLKK